MVADPPCVSRRVSRSLIAVGGALVLFSVAFSGSSTVSDTSALSSSTPAAAGKARYATTPTSSLARDFLLDEGNALPAGITRFLAETPVDTDQSTQGMRMDFVAESQLTLTVLNAYTRTSPIQTGKFAYPWWYLAEPFKAHALSAVNGVDPGAWYKWVVDDHTQGYGATCDVLWTSLGWKSVVLIEKLNGTTTCTIAAKVQVKYARREIRSLTDQDRETFFQAAMVLQRVPTEVGQRLYGSAYKSKDYFTRVHLYYGGTSDCDHWHQGAGFVTSHVAFTLEFEQAIQSVSPSVSMPYWDFTIESTLYEPGTFRSSLIFSDDWFGNASPDNDLHTLTEGRWAFVPATANARNFSEVVNSYGVLRAPWNNDPTPFLTRYCEIYGYENNMKPSGCKEYNAAVKKTTWMSMSRQLNSAAHGHIHETIGGAWNHYFAEMNEYVTTPAIMTFAHGIQGLSKELWRAGYSVCPEQCAMDTAWVDCQCQCTPTSIKGKESYDILDDAGVLAAVSYYDQQGHTIDQFYDANGTIYYTLPGYDARESKHIYDSLLKVLCSPGHIGDMFQATSTNDITFWVLHPAVDRLWHYKRLGNQHNYDETWDPYHNCYGHNPTDYLPFKNLFDTDDRFYTNAELYENLRPNTAVLPYVYDHFKWPHCDLIGLPVSNEW